jgi:hypothetical protein
VSAAAEARPTGAGRALIADPRLPVALFAAATAVSGVLLVALNAQLTFFIDDWEVLLHRRGFNVDAFFVDHAGHPSMGLVAVYKAIQATLGMDSLTPYAVASTLAFLASVVLLFIWMRRRVGEWLAFAGCLPVLFLGAALEDLLTPFQIGYFVPMACGIGGLLALERRDRRGDVICCALLVVAICFQSVGLIFIAATAVAIAWDRELLSRAWVPAIPAVLYGLWYLGWGGATDDQASFINLATSPAFIVDGYASSLSSLLGLAAARDETVIGALDWGRPLLALLVVAAGARLLSTRELPKWFLVVLTAGAGFWFLTALNATFLRAATSSRYQYIGVVLLLMAIAELARGYRPGWRVVVGALAISLAATASNASTLRDAYLGLKGTTPVVRGGLAGLEIAADDVDPRLVLTPENADFNYFTLVDAGSYLSAVEAFGSPAYSEPELAAAPENGRVAADKVLAAAHRIALEPLSSATGCSPVPAGPSGAAVVELPTGPTVVRAPDGADLSLRRYATESFPVELGPLEAGEAAVLELPPDRASEPWELEATGGSVELCAS